MSDTIVGTLAKLTRIDTSIIVFLSIFMPIYINLGSLHMSIGYSMPALVIAMLTFVANDYDDLEEDKVNHPSRPIPSGRISGRSAIILYFSLIFVFITSVYLIEDAAVVMLYSALCILVISYRYVKSELIAIKSIYVAMCNIFPIAIVGSISGDISRKVWLSCALFMFSISRELLMDVLDMKGDGGTIPNLFGERWSIRIGIFLQLPAIFCMYALGRTAIDLFVASIIAMIAASAISLWLRSGSRRAAIGVMKLPMLFGIYYLC